MLTHRHMRFAHPVSLVALFAVIVAAIALVLLLAASAASADGQRIWTTGYPATDGLDYWTSLASGPSGTVYACGTSDYEAPTEHAVVGRFASSGRQLWLKSFGGRAGDAVATGIAVDAMGNAFVVGVERYGTPADWHIFVMKLSGRSGKRLWLRRYDGPATTGNDRAYAVALGPKAAVYVTGQTYVDATGYDAVLFKYVDKGRRAVLRWKRTYANPLATAPYNADEGSRVVVDGRGRVFWAGSSEEADEDYTVFVRRVTPKTGRPVWTDRVVVPVDASLWLTDLAVFPGGGVVTASQREDVPSTGRDVVVKRYTAKGAVVFDTTVESADDEFVNDLAVGGGAIAVCGGLTSAGNGITSAWVMRGDARFQNAWQMTYASPVYGQTAGFSGIAIGALGALYCGGTSVAATISGSDFTMVKYSAQGSQKWADALDDLGANGLDAVKAVLYVGGRRPGLYAAGLGGQTPNGEALLVKYRR